MKPERNLLSKTKKGSLMVIGVYNGLSTLLAQRAGADAVWASGFCISASKGVPDRNVISVEQLYSCVAEMVNVAKVPVIVDCDEGYGDVKTTAILAAKLESVGAAAICLEDNVFPKINSFHPKERLLAQKTELSEKIQIVKKVAPGLRVIARTEALIVGASLEEAVARASTYEEAGADYVLLHSKSKQIEEYKIIREVWPSDLPQIVIPTLSAGVTFDQLEKLGYEMVIYANQILRACLGVSELMLAKLRTTGDPSTIANLLVSMDHVFDIVDAPDSLDEIMHPSILNVIEDSIFSRQDGRCNVRMVNANEGGWKKMPEV